MQREHSTDGFYERRRNDLTTLTATTGRRRSRTTARGFSPRHFESNFVCFYLLETLSSARDDEIGNPRKSQNTRPKSNDVALEQHEIQKERVLYEYFSSRAAHVTQTDDNSDKEKLSVFAVLLAACALSLRRYLERAILPRAYFLTFSSSKAERDAAL